METCCSSPYSLCDKIASCFTSFIIYLPADYLENTASILITNGQGNGFRQLLPVIAGRYVELDLLDGTIPDGFFSAYGGPYRLEFLSIVSGLPITFTAKDGLTHESISFGFMNLSGGDDVAFINAFSDEMPDPY